MQFRSFLEVIRDSVLYNDPKKKDWGGVMICEGLLPAGAGCSQKFGTGLGLNFGFRAQVSSVSLAVLEAR